jgi:plasmid stabilization system protein ParE
MYAPSALRDLQRLRDFLRPNSPNAAKRAAETIISGLELLGLQPHMGRSIKGMSEQYREWLIDFGDSGYVARYRVDGDRVVILALRHQKELGY